MVCDISKMELIKDKSNESHFLFRISESLNYVSLNKNPTGNCQLYSIGYANQILDYENALDIFAFLHERALKNRVLLDVYTSLCNKVESIFDKDDIVIKDSYINSTYNSQMTMYILKTDKIIQRMRDNLKEKATTRIEEQPAQEENVVTTDGGIVEQISRISRNRYGDHTLKYGYQVPNEFSWMIRK